METTATWDQKTQEFVVNCPTVKSHKYWITNGACHAHYAVVFAQTIVNGKNEGINLFLVPIRDDKLNAKPGVYIEDMGFKLGNNGVDNAKIIFSNVRIPREMLLNKVCNMSTDGVFTHEVKKTRDRFLEVADRLLSGRICIACMTLAGAKSSCALGIAYSKRRLAVGKTGESDTPIFDYQLQQNALIPLLAKTVCYQFGLNNVKDNFHNLYIEQKGNHMDIVRECCVIKALLTWHATETATVVRERCGGQGYLSVNRVAGGIGDSHAGLTAEGDNRVLIQKVSKELITDLGKGNYEHPEMTMDESELPKVENIANTKFLYNLIVHRQIVTSGDLMENMRYKIMEKKQQLFEVWMKQESDLIQLVGESFGEQIVFSKCYKMLEQKAFGSVNHNVIENMVILYGLTDVRKYLGWYLSRGLLNLTAAKNLDKTISGLVKLIAPHSEGILEAFDLNTFGTPIANDYLAYNEKPNFGELGPAPKL